jgi:hypothetical protein
VLQDTASARFRSICPWPAHIQQPLAQRCVVSGVITPSESPAIPTTILKTEHGEGPLHPERGTSA